ncbi:winged helix-turn-helix domain-containing protein [Phenylobacterium sp.]|uniref:winged helix-turn-helix domain-containing protein n=1 Tax=Phenylobacterium sp. TaxID=1871053 RepID=UPI0035682363
MNERVPTPSPPVQLALEPDFSLGGLAVRPSRGEVEADGRVERLEPRVMQVLVALASRQASTVSRDELTARCWGGVVVSDDAINRAISLLRALAARADGAFRIETRSRIGYRLLPSPPLGAAPSAEAGARRLLVAVLPFDGDGGPGAAGLAEGVSEAILSKLVRNGGLAVAARHSSFQFRGARKAEAAAALKPSHMVDGSVRVRDGVVRVNAYLVDAERDVVLWSEESEGPASQVFAAQARIAERVANTLQVRLRRQRAPDAVDAAAFELYARALHSLEQPGRESAEQAVAYLNQVVAAAPNFAAAWASLAEAQRLRMLYFPPLRQAAGRAESKASAERALEIDPGLGQAYGALASLIPRFGRWREVEALFERGLALTPESPALRQLHAQFLLAVGRTAEGLESLLALQRLNPLSASVAVELAAALADAGRAREALAQIDRAYALWPAIMLVWSERIRLHLLAGHDDVVEEMLAAPPPSVGRGDENVARRRLHLKARRDRRPEDLAAARQNFLDFAQIGIVPAVVAIHALTTLDETGPALAVADEIFRLDAPQSRRTGVNMMGTYALGGQPDTTVLFRCDTASIRWLDGFQAIVEHIGLADYWQDAGIIPDFAR